MRHSIEGSNQRGVLIADLISRNIAKYLGPDFNTLANVVGTGKPDMVLSNNIQIIIIKCHSKFCSNYLVTNIITFLFTKRLKRI